MHFPVILAHGALGPYDEVIMGGAAAIFLIMMGISWVKSRNSRSEAEDDTVKPVPIETPEAITQVEEHEREQTADRFRLD